jgi:hypothetical protein
LNTSISRLSMRLPLAYSLPRNLTVKASVSVVTAYYVRVSGAALASAFISAETEKTSNCRRCLAMDVRVDSYNQPLSGTSHYIYIYFFPLALQTNSGLSSLHETLRFTSVTRFRTVGWTPWKGEWDSNPRSWRPRERRQFMP